MPPLEIDWVLAQAATDELEGYLLSEKLYWPVPGAPARPASIPSFSLGNLLLSLKRLQSAGLQPAKQDELQVILQEVAQVRERWRSHWQRKAEAEFRERLIRWQEFLNELRKDDRPSDSDYVYQVRQRVILDLLVEEAGSGKLDAEKQGLASLDRLLKLHFKPGDFIWDSDMRFAFPVSQHWYLYGLPAAA